MTETFDFTADEPGRVDRSYDLPAGGWRARGYQQPFWNALENGVRKFCIVWPRRHGKTMCLLHAASVLSQKRVGTIRHVFPTLKQARSVVWNEVDNDGRPMLSAFPDFDNFGPGKFIVRKREDEMRLECANGSAYQLSGADEPDTALRGGNAVVWLLDEYPTSPKMRTVFHNVVQPIVRLNGGIIIVAFTPRGKNHGWKLFEMAQTNPDWFCQRLTSDETSWVATESELRRVGWDDEHIAELDWKDKKSIRVPVVAPWMIEKERAEGMSEPLIRQEYYCDFEGADENAVYGDLLKKADAEGRLGEFPYDPNYPVETSLDLGVMDHTVIWFVQQVKGRFHFIDYLEGQGQPLTYYLSEIQNRPYAYIAHHAPHDLAHRERWSANSGVEVSGRFGIRFRVAPKLLISEGISATRNILVRACFNTASEAVAEGVERLKKYRYQIDNQRDEILDTPIHDSNSHAADALRTYAVGHRVLNPWAKSGPLHRPLPRR